MIVKYVVTYIGKLVFRKLSEKHNNNSSNNPNTYYHTHAYNTNTSPEMIDLKSQAQNAHGGMAGFILRFIARSLQFVLGIAVIGLYATDLHNAGKAGSYYDSKWVYAVVVGTLSAITALVYGLPFRVLLLWAWDAVLFLLWIVVFGIFGKMYIHEDAEENGGVQRMKNAVWLDCVNMLLWLMTAVEGCVVWLKARNARTMHTGRAEV